MQTDNLELKKLVYLYMMNYAKSQPDMAIMAVNTFVKVGMRPDMWSKYMRGAWQGKEFRIALSESNPFFDREPKHMENMEDIVTHFRIQFESRALAVV